VAAVVAWTVRGRWDGAYARRLALAVGTGAVVALGVAAVQIFPTLEVVARAVRGPSGLTLGQTYAPRMAATELGQLTYVAGPVLGLVVVGLVEWRRPWAAAAAVVVIVATQVAVGGPFYRAVFYRLPAVNLFRMPQQIETIGFLATGLLAGLGVDVARRTRHAWPVWLRAAVALALAASVPFLVDPPLRFAVTTLVVATAMLVLLARPVPGAWLLVAAIVVQRYVAVENQVMLTEHNDASFFAPPPFVGFLKEHAGSDRVLLIKNWNRRFPYMEKLGTLWGVHMAQDYEPLSAAAYHEFLRPLESANVDRPLFWGRLQPRPNDPKWWLLDALAVRYVVVAAGRTWAATPPRFRLVYDDPDARIYESTTAWPRAYVAERWRVMPNAAFSLTILQSGRADPRNEPAVDRDDPVHRDPAATGENRAAITAETNDTVSLEVSSPRGGLVVLADLFWPGWRVTVDGTERECLRVNDLFRGVTVEPGSHTVRFRYVPVRLYVGAAVTATTTLVVACWALVRALDSRRVRPRLGAA
jgi:hypothetical protein